jgi:catechol 2,3-dioxygenase-like lactoylglutathione lyase family enzyme
MSGRPTRPEAAALPWRGFHHLAVITPDLDATIRFYRDAVGMRIGWVGPADPPLGRDCTVIIGGEGTSHIHFFEQLGAQVQPTDPENLLAPPPGGSGIHHVAFGLPDEAAALALRERLRAHGVPMSEIMDQGGFRDMVFRDNNGVLLEAAWPDA